MRSGTVHWAAWSSCLCRPLSPQVSLAAPSHLLPNYILATVRNERKQRLNFSLTPSKVKTKKVRDNYVHTIEHVSLILCNYDLRKPDISSYCHGLKPHNSVDHHFYLNKFLPGRGESVALWACAIGTTNQGLTSTPATKFSSTSRPLETHRAETWTTAESHVLRVTDQPIFICGDGHINRLGYLINIHPHAYPFNSNVSAP